MERGTLLDMLHQRHMFDSVTTRSKLGKIWGRLVQNLQGPDYGFNFLYCLTLLLRSSQDYVTAIWLRIKAEMEETWGYN